MNTISIAEAREKKREEEAFTEASKVFAKRARALMEQVIAEGLQRGGYSAYMVLSQLEGNLMVCATLLRANRTEEGRSE